MSPRRAHTRRAFPFPCRRDQALRAYRWNTTALAVYGIAGVGWDLSVGWPTLIARDTLLGTPTWNLNSAWIWGGHPLVSVAPTGCSEQNAPCAYRTAPDSLARITIDPRSASATAEVTLPSGIVLSYNPIRYDGSTYPSAPFGAATNVFAFVLASVKTPNGYLTCFLSTHAGDAVFGRVTVLSEILYGPPLRDCASPPVSNALHRITFDYVDPTVPGLDYAASMSYRFGVPVSFNNLLKAVTVHIAGSRTASDLPA